MRTWKRNLKAATLLFGVMLFQGCGKPVPATSVTIRTITDCADRVVTVPSAPTRIVSCAPATTEIICALGGADRIVGVTEFCNYPPTMKAKAKIGGFSPKTINLETLASLKPDIVFAAPGEQGPMIDAITRLGIPVVGIEARSFEEVYKSILVVGLALNQEKESEALVTMLRSRTESVKRKSITQKPRVFYLLNETPLMTAGPNTFVGELIRTAGGENIFDDAKTLYPTVNEEELLRRNPDVIVIPSGSGLKPDVNKLFARPAWKALTAVKNKRVIWIDEDAASRAGPRLIDALEDLTTKLRE